jgi:hypothetical protein
MIEGRVLGEAAGPLRIVFRDGPGELLAVGVAGVDTRLGVDRHRLRYSDGSVVWVESDPAAPRGRAGRRASTSGSGASTVLRRGDGTAVGHILRGDTATAVAATGGTLCHLVPHPKEPETPELFRLVILDRSGDMAGHLDVIRTADGWTRHPAPDEAGDIHLWWDRTGRSLPVPILGTRLVMHHRMDRTERDVLLGACVDIAIGLRPYITVMR